MMMWTFVVVAAVAAASAAANPAAPPPPPPAAAASAAPTTTPLDAVEVTQPIAAAAAALPPDDVRPPPPLPLKVHQSHCQQLDTQKHLEQRAKRISQLKIMKMLTLIPCLAVTCGSIVSAVHPDVPLEIVGLLVNLGYVFLIGSNLYSELVHTYLRDAFSIESAAHQITFWSLWSFAQFAVSPGASGKNSVLWSVMMFFALALHMLLRPVPMA